MEMRTMALTPKQQAFIAEYLVDLNATQAAIRAGYSEDTATVIGYENLTKPHIAKVIQEAMEKRATRTEITADRVLKEYAKIAFSDMKDFLSFRTAQTVVEHDKITGEPIIDYAQIIEMNDSDQVDGTMIQEVSISPKGVFAFKLHDKKGALDMIGKHLGMFTDKLEVNGSMVIFKGEKDLED
jgi:phage terminase small subunit